LALALAKANHFELERRPSPVATQKKSLQETPFSLVLKYLASKNWILDCPIAQECSTRARQLSFLCCFANLVWWDCVLFSDFPFVLQA
jgi:hypothetical protein